MVTEEVLSDTDGSDCVRRGSAVPLFGQRYKVKCDSPSARITWQSKFFELGTFRIQNEDCTACVVLLVPDVYCPHIRII